MNIHEFQAKSLFSQYGIPVPFGKAVYSVDEAEQVAKRRAAIGRRPDSREGDRLRLVGEGQKDNAVCRQQRRGRADDGDAKALSDQRQKGATPHVEAQDRRRRPALGMA